MLKLIYTELGLHMEYVGDSLETVVSQHVILTVRTGQSLHIELGQAAFLLPVLTPGLGSLEMALRQYAKTLEVTRVDAEYVEVSLAGTWIAQVVAAHEGMFFVAYDYETELILHRLWHTADQALSAVTSD